MNGGGKSDRPAAKSATAKLFTIAGTVFVIASVFVFVCAFIPQCAQKPFVHIVIGILSFIFGYTLLRSPRTTGTIPEQDQTLVFEHLSKRPTFIEEYRSLRQLVGVPGFFRNLDLWGLPLATIAVTLLFCLLAIACYGVNALSAAEQKPIPVEFPQTILELSKLTLGAFIGSFVSKNGRVITKPGESETAIDRS